MMQNKEEKMNMMVVKAITNVEDVKQTKISRDYEDSSEEEVFEDGFSRSMINPKTGKCVISSNFNWWYIKNVSIPCIRTFLFIMKKHVQGNLLINILLSLGLKKMIFFNE